MKPQYQHKVMTSFFLWFDNYLLSEGAACSIKTGKFFIDQTDERLSNSYSIYASPYKQWVTDSGIALKSADVPNVVDYISGDKDKKIYRGTSGMKIDYENGRVFFTGDNAGNIPSTDLEFSGAFAVKDFNLYVTNQTEEDLVVENAYKTNSRFDILETGVTPYDQVLPAIFITNEGSQNEPIAFGGENETRTSMKAVVMAGDLYCLECVLSLGTDARHRSFTPINFEDFPVTEFGDIKTDTYSTGFHYQTVADENTDELFHIENVTSSKLSDKINKRINPNIFVGFIDFELVKFRYPRSDTTT